MGLDNGDGSRLKIREETRHEGGTKGEESWRAWEPAKVASTAGGRLQKQLICAGVSLGFVISVLGQVGH